MLPPPISPSSLCYPGVIAACIRASWAFPNLVGLRPKGQAALVHELAEVEPACKAAPVAPPVLIAAKKTILCELWTRRESTWMVRPELAACDPRHSERSHRRFIARAGPKSAFETQSRHCRAHH